MRDRSVRRAAIDDEGVCARVYEPEHVGQRGRVPPCRRPIRADKVGGGTAVFMSSSVPGELLRSGVREVSSHREVRSAEAVRLDPRLPQRSFGLSELSAVAAWACEIHLSPELLGVLSSIAAFIALMALFFLYLSNKLSVETPDELSHLSSFNNNQQGTMGLSVLKEGGVRSLSS
ncbi:hypothetical protein D4764_19G0005650 [Takifugu flavidus]|uniref:Uncharacterized protein n=1 Tax=Takifugu flavidus TaxID=433684 RepID=A0A5C6NT54_9TELE|nr:hypothetical protein D4764_19G0005650 [Takifugu flavidus]